MFEIHSKKYLTSNILLMEVKSPWVARSAKPGQFIIVIIDDKGERIPLTICDIDKEKGLITIVFQVLGKSTQRMSELGLGDGFRDVVGPLGQKSLFLHQSLDVLRSKKFLFVAGGVGTAPIYPQVKWMKQAGIDVDVIIGTKSKDTLIFEDEFRSIAKNLYICTDDGSYGEKGLVTDKIKDLIDNKAKHYDEVISVGPMIMMKFVSILTKDYGIKTTVSLNSLMVDGTGMCGACRVSIGGETKFTCVDGPEFDAHLVDFDEAMRRQSMYKTQEIGKNTEAHTCNLTAPVDNSLNADIIVDRNKRVKVREQDPIIRSGNFEEVSYGYNEKEAMAEASRCIQCKNPGCVTNCPVSVKIPQFIFKVKVGDFEDAARILAEDTALPAVCGRVCPQEVQCEARCILGKRGEPVAIGKLERFVADWARNNNISFSQPPKTKLNNKVAIVGAGPAGLTCAGDLAKMGYDVTIFEALHEAGGVLVYGIPEFRLPKEDVVKFEVDNIKKLGVKIITDVIIGRSITIDEILNEEGYSAVFIATGAGLPKFMGIPGENLNGVLSANEILTRSNLMKAYEKGYDTPIYLGSKTIVVGGGNVAMDAARTAKRLGADTHIVYRRSEEEMPARVEEVHHAKQEGIRFNTMTNPLEIISDEKGWVKSLKCIRMKLGEPDQTGRRRPIEIKDSEFIIEADCVVMALGTSPNPLIINTTKGLDSEKWGGIIADEFGRTSKKGVFAGGDAVIGAATVILAMGAGKQAAKGIHNYIQSL